MTFGPRTHGCTSEREGVWDRGGDAVTLDRRFAARIVRRAWDRVDARVDASAWALVGTRVMDRVWNRVGGDVDVREQEAVMR